MSFEGPVVLRTCDLQNRLQVVGTGRKAPFCDRRRLRRLHPTSFPLRAVL